MRLSGNQVSPSWTLSWCVGPGYSLYLLADVLSYSVNSACLNKVHKSLYAEDLLSEGRPIVALEMSIGYISVLHRLWPLSNLRHIPSR